LENSIEEAKKGVERVDRSISDKKDELHRLDTDLEARRHEPPTISAMPTPTSSVAERVNQATPPSPTPIMHALGKRPLKSNNNVLNQPVFSTSTATSPVYPDPKRQKQQDQDEENISEIEMRGTSFYF
jgi:hypothetical protein